MNFVRFPKYEILFLFISLTLTIGSELRLKYFTSFQVLSPRTALSTLLAMMMRMWYEICFFRIIWTILKKPLIALVCEMLWFIKTINFINRSFYNWFFNDFNNLKKEKGFSYICLYIIGLVRNFQDLLLLSLRVMIFGLICHPLRWTLLLIEVSLLLVISSPYGH